MTNQSAPQAKTSRLDYAPEPAVGSISLTRVGDASVITMRPSWQRALRAMGGVGMVIVPGIVFVLLNAWVWPTRSVAPSVPWIAFGCYVLLVLGTNVQPLFTAMNAIEWTVDSSGIKARSRRPTQVLVEICPRAGIADVRVERTRLKTMVLKRPGLVVINPGGQRFVHSWGTQAELLFMARAFKEALGMGDDPLGESRFSTKPRGSPVQRRIGQRLVVLTVRPPLVGAIGWLVIVAVLVAMAWYDWHVAQEPERRSGIPHLATYVIAAIIAVIAGGLPLQWLYKIRRQSTIARGVDGISLTEHALLRPGYEFWPAERVAGLSLRVTGKRADLLLHLVDQSAIPLISGGLTRDVRYIHESLSCGMPMTIAASPVPVLSPDDEVMFPQPPGSGPLAGNGAT